MTARPVGHTAVCPAWCVEHALLDDVYVIHRGPEVYFGEPDGCTGFGLPVRLESTDDSGVQINVNTADLSLTEARRLAEHLLSIVELAGGVS